MSSSITKRVKDGRKLMAELTKLNEVNATLYWHRAEKIWALKRDNLWKYVYGEDGMTWANFCFQELKTPASSADQKAVAYDFFVRKHGFKIDELAPYDAYSMYYVAMYKKEEPKTAIKQLMKESLVLNRKDFIAWLRGKDCGHEHTHQEEEKVIVCEDCQRIVQKLNKRKKK